MRHYSNHHSSSRTYYKELQKNNSKNLNLSTKKLDTLEFYLEKFLKITYKHLSPIFEDDEVMSNFKNETTNNYIDKKVDEQINNHTPLWIQSIATLFIHLYQKYFSKTFEEKVFKPLKCFVEFLNQKSETKHRLKNSFILNKSSP